MTDKDKLGAINVEMGDGNTVGHIGHKITYHAPPPPPNAVRRNGEVIGVFEGQPTQQGRTVVFPKLIFSTPFAVGDEFEVQGVKLRITDFAIGGSMRMMGFGERFTYQQATCQVVG